MKAAILEQFGGPNTGSCEFLDMGGILAFIMAASMVTGSLRWGASTALLAIGRLSRHLNYCDSYFEGQT